MDPRIEQYTDKKLEIIKGNLENTLQLDRIEMKLEVLLRSIGKIEYHMGLGVKYIITSMNNDDKENGKDVVIGELLDDDVSGVAEYYRTTFQIEDKVVEYFNGGMYFARVIKVNEHSIVLIRKNDEDKGGKIRILEKGYKHIHKITELEYEVEKV